MSAFLFPSATIEKPGRDEGQGFFSSFSLITVVFSSFFSGPGVTTVLFSTFLVSTFFSPEGTTTLASQADKNTIIAHTMQFTDTESTAFWPVYRDYARDQQAIGDKRVQLIKDYAQSYDSMDDNEAKDLVQRMINIEDETLNLREDYWPKFMKALGARRAARFYQVDNRLTLMVNLQIAANVPLVP